jgi:transcriptional regulator with XRE-family HTH domain
MPGRRTSSSSSTLGRRLRLARERTGLPQDRLGVLAGLEESSSSARISRYESGVHEPSLSFTESLAKVLGVPAAYFFCSDDRLAEIILAYADMSETQRQALHTKAVELAEL